MAGMKRKWGIGVLLVLGISAILLFVIRAAKGERYSFLTDLSGEKRGPGVFTMHDTRDWYTFKGPPIDVRDAMKREMADHGWRVLYEDGEYAAFGRKGLHGDDLAEFSTCEPGFAGAQEHDTRAIVTMPHPPSNWVQDAMESMANRFQKAPKLRGIQAFLHGRDLKIDKIERVKDGKAQITFVFQNRSPALMTATVSDIFLRGYESDQASPIPLSLPPYAAERKVITFPLAAATSREGGVDYVCVYSSLSRSASGRYGTIGREPMIQLGGGALAGGAPGTRTVILENESQWRAGELRDLEIKVNRVASVKHPSLILFAPRAKSRLTIPFSRVGFRVLVEVTGLWRLSPNRRWIRFSESF
jgi:hypothetical protein